MTSRGRPAPGRSPGGPVKPEATWAEVGLVAVWLARSTTSQLIAPLARRRGVPWPCKPPGIVRTR